MVAGTAPQEGSETWSAGGRQGSPGL